MWPKIAFSVWLLIIQNVLADVEEPEELDFYELILDCRDGNLEQVKQRAAKFGTEKILDRGLCFYAALDEDKKPELDPQRADLISYLLQIGENPNRHFTSIIPLAYAAKRCKLSVVKALLAHGADATYNNSTALHWSSCPTDEKQREMARLLLQHCANPNAVDPGWERTPFMDAVYWVRIGAIREMAKWMETVPEVEEKDVWNPNLLDDIRRAIQEGQNARKMLREAEREEPLGGGGSENACSPLTSAIAQ